MKYTLENGNVNLSKVTNKINCHNCTNTLVLTNDPVIFIRNACLLDLENKEVTVKCTKCKAFITLKIDEINKKSVKFKLTV